jgi:hypothetical protein
MATISVPYFFQITISILTQGWTYLWHHCSFLRRQAYWQTFKKSKVACASFDREATSEDASAGEHAFRSDALGVIMSACPHICRLNNF